MKKVLLVVLFVLIVVAGSVLWIWRAMGVTDAAVLLPANTVAFASLPDLPRTLLRWPQTTLAKIGVEPEMKAFLEKPLAYLTQSPGGEEASGILIQLKPGRIFAAAVSVSANDAAILVGFQYWGGKVAHEAAVTRLRQELALGGPLPELVKETHAGIEITSGTQRGLTLYNASHGQWGFLSNNLEVLKDTLDRAAGRQSAGSLAENPRYQTVSTHILKDPDFLFFVQPETALDALVAVGQSLGAQAIPQQMEEAKKIEALGGAVKLDGANLRDSVFVLRQNPPDIGTLSHSAIQFSTPNTIGYFNFVTDFRQLAGVRDNPALTPFLSAPALQDSPLPQLVSEAFGPECTVVVNWAAQPDALLAVRVKDAAKADQSLRELQTLFPETTVSEEGGNRSYSFPALQSPFANPTLTLTGDFLLVGLGPDSIHAALQSAQTGETLEKSPVFATALPVFRSANEVFGFIDAKAIFEQGYPMLRQVAVFSAAVMPGVSDIIDTGKIPETETISKHLSPILYSQTRLADGYLVESSGPVTMNQALLLGVAAGGSLWKPPGTR